MAESKELTFKQLRAIAAMATESSHEAAAKKAGVHVKTLNLWRRSPAFQKLLQDQAKLMFEASTMMTIASATETLQKGLDAEKAADRIKATTAIMNFALKAYELQVLRNEFAKLKNLEEAAIR